METGFNTNLYVFTGHIFHDSREEIRCIFTSSNHLQKKHHEVFTKKRYFSKDFLRLFCLFHLLCPAVIIYEDVDVKLQKGGADYYEHLTAEFVPLWFYHLKLPLVLVGL